MDSGAISGYAVDPCYLKANRQGLFMGQSELNRNTEAWIIKQVRVLRREHDKAAVEFDVLAQRHLYVVWNRSCGGLQKAITATVNG